MCSLLACFVCVLLATCNGSGVLIVIQFTGRNDTLDRHCQHNRLYT